ncbi:plant U-box 23 [Wolffia australiana]
MEDKKVEIPPYFLCPISLEIMKDPVTVCTGITYDRESIEKWIFSGNKRAEAVCPVTRQPIPNGELIPNHTLRRLIQSWCAANAAAGVERFPTPRAPLDSAAVARLLDEARNPSTKLTALRKLRSLAMDSERNRRCLQSANTADFILSQIRASLNPNPNSPATEEEEALGVLLAMQISAQVLAELAARNDDIADLLTSVLRLWSCQSRACAVVILRYLFEAVSPARLCAVKEELFEELVKVMKDRISSNATKAALRAIAAACPWGRNRVKAAAAGAVPVIVEILLEDSDRRTSEFALVVLEKLCACAEGRAALLAHAGGLAVVEKRMIRVSPLATDRAVKIMTYVAKLSATGQVLQEMVQVGAVAKLCLVAMHESSTSKAKERAVGILRLHAKAWSKSPCVPHHLLSFYPSH